VNPTGLLFGSGSIISLRMASNTTLNFRSYLSLHGIKLLCQIGVACQDFMKARKGAHDFYVYANRSLAPENSGEHGYPVLSEKRTAASGGPLRHQNWRSRSVTSNLRTRSR
jgi:hypothetical protein